MSDIISFFIICFLIFIFFNKKNEKNKNNKNNFKKLNKNLKIIENLILITDNKYCKKNIDNVVDINDECDFIKCYSKINYNEDLNIIIYSEGSLVSSSDAIVNILLKHKGFINIFIPSICYSGASMIALCGDNIYMNNYSLMSPVDPQISFIKLKNSKGLKKLSDENIIKYYESKSLYDDNLRNMGKILDNKYSKQIIRKIKKNFGHGIYPHEKQFNIDELENMGMRIISPIPKDIQENFEKFLLT